MAEEEKTPLQIANERLEDLEEKSEGFLEGLTDKVAGSFWNRVKEFFAVMAGLQGVGTLDTFKDLYSIIDLDIAEKAQILLVEESQVSIQHILDTAGDANQILQALEKTTKTLPYVGWLFSLGQWVFNLFGMVTANLSSTMELATQQVMVRHRPTLLPLDATIEAYYKDPTVKADIEDILSRMGLSDKFQEMLWTATVTPLDAMTAREAFLREEIDELEHDTILKAQHLSDIDIATLKKLYQLIPPVSDIITMAVREVFTPEIVERFGQMQDLPPDFVKWAGQKGLSDYWTKAYWASHWALPSILQGFEMLHRQVIDQSDLDLLLRALDVMPFWRDKLTAISFRPLTRVDVRRMHRIGVIDEDGVFKAYRDVGYSDDNAQLMTEFTVAYNMEKSRELSKTDIIALYKKVVIDRETAHEMLTTLGYSEVDANMILQRADYEVYASFKKEQIGYIKKAHIAGKITESEALSRLGQLDMPSAEINALMESWDLARRSKVRDLSLDNLKAFFKAKVISVAELQVELKELGYSVQDVGRFVILFGKVEAK